MHEAQRKPGPDYSNREFPWPDTLEEVTFANPDCEHVDQARLDEEMAVQGMVKQQADACIDVAYVGKMGREGMPYVRDRSAGDSKRFRARAGKLPFNRSGSGPQARCLQFGRSSSIGCSFSSAFPEECTG